ncbi:hypothetical protein Tco_1060491 [Tanacetum coccineum]
MKIQFEWPILHCYAWIRLLGDVYQNYPSARELWKALEKRFFTEDATSILIVLARIWDAVNQVFKYLKKTIDYSLEYSRESSVLEGYTDASWITDQEDYTSTSEWIFTVGGCSVLGIKETELFNRLYYGRRVCGIGVMLQRSRMATGLVNKHTFMAETYAANL